MSWVFYNTQCTFFSLNHFYRVVLVKNYLPVNLPVNRRSGKFLRFTTLVLILNNLQCSSRPVLGKLPRWRASCPTLGRQANFLPEGLELIWLPFFGVLSYSREEIVWHDSPCICHHGINLVSFRFFSSTFPSFAKDDEWMNFWRHQIKKSWLCWLEVGVRRGHLLLAKNEWRHGQWKGAKVSMLGALTKSCDM